MVLILKYTSAKSNTFWHYLQNTLFLKVLPNTHENRNTGDFLLGSEAYPCMYIFVFLLVLRCAPPRYMPIQAMTIHGCCKAATHTQ